MDAGASGITVMADDVNENKPLERAAPAANLAAVTAPFTISAVLICMAVFDAVEITPEASKVNDGIVLAEPNTFDVTLLATAISDGDTLVKDIIVLY